MAEGEEKVKSSTEGTGRLCDVCQEDNSFEPAPWYCRQCKQLLCEQCKRYHRKLAISKAHELIQAEDAPLTEPANQGEVSDEVRTPMCLTHNQPFEFYCREHNTPVCASCKLVDHRKCTDLQDLELAAKENAELYEEVLDHLKAVSAGMDDISIQMEKEKDSIESQKDKVIEKIENNMKEIESVGRKQIFEVVSMFKDENESLDRERKVVKESQQLILSKIAELEFAAKVGSPEEKFLTAKFASMEAGKYYDILSESSHVKHRVMDFCLDGKLEDISSIGSFSLHKTMTSTDYHRHLVKVIKVDETDIVVTWVDMLPNKQIALIFRNTSTERLATLQLYSSSKQLLSKLNISVPSAIILNGNQVIVPKQGTGLQLVNIGQNRLTLGEHIETNLEHTLITKFSANSILTVHRERSHNGSLTLTCHKLNGEIKAEISISDKRIKEPCFVEVNKTGDVVYMVDHKTGCYGINLKGECLFHSEHNDSTLYLGLAVDHNDNIYLSYLYDEKEKVIIVQLSPTCIFQKQLLEVPTFAYPIKCIENKLYIAAIVEQQGKQIPTVYQLYV